MDKSKILVALKDGLTVCHNNTRNIVKMNNKGILFVTDFRTNKPYELSTKSQFEDCFIKGL